MPSSSCLLKGHRGNKYSEVKVSEVEGLFVPQITLNRDDIKVVTPQPPITLRAENIFTQKGSVVSFSGSVLMFNETATVTDESLVISISLPLGRGKIFTGVSTATNDSEVKSTPLQALATTPNPEVPQEKVDLIVLLTSTPGSVIVVQYQVNYLVTLEKCGKKTESIQSISSLSKVVRSLMLN